ncbi:hypothetical protein [Maricaulis sp.]|uniref:hypothetical protein n=1 Tax=Maricaulis sp. TaxID=1486257 RepID=UPI002614B6A6|nr:hypothetical protein [Maricaulis sp.]
MNVRLLLLISPLALAAAAQAQTGASPLQPLFECREIVDDSARLACLDAAVDALRDEAASGEVVAVEREQIEAAEEATYGLSIPNFRLPSLSLPGFGGDNSDMAEAETAPHSPDRVVVRNDDGLIERIEGLAITEMTVNRLGKVELTLANGQRWRQTDSERVFRASRGAFDGLTATIRSGALGSYFISLSNSSGWFRAERIE